MISENELRLIEQYLDEKLDLIQKREVERRIAEDREFALQFEIIRDLPKAVNMETDHLRDDLRSMMQQPIETSRQNIPVDARMGRRVSLVRLLVSAAAVIAGVTLAINLFTPTKDADLYATYFDIPQENITLRNEGLDPLLAEATRSFSEKNYPSAAESFRQFLMTDPDEIPVLFFYAVSLMALEEYDTAQPVLTEIQSQESVYRNAAKWYLGLLYLRKEDHEKARTLFEELKNGANNYSEKASEICLQIAE
jgi:tetratricopeptide (TPR) repeat protein